MRNFNLPPGIALRDLEPEAPEAIEQQQQDEAMNSAALRAKEIAIEQMIERHVHRENSPHLHS